MAGMATTLAGTLPALASRDQTAAGRAATTTGSLLRWLTGPALHAAIRARDFSLQAGGLALLAYAASEVNEVAGYAAAGVALLVLQALLRPSGTTVTEDQLRVMFAAARSGMTDEDILYPTHDGEPE